MTGHRTPRVIALFPWGDVIEEFLEPIGLELQDFVERMTGGWLFGYAAALSSVGHKPIIVCASERVSRIECYVHSGTGTPIWVAPARRSRQGHSPAAYSLRRWAATPLAAFREILIRSRCNVLLAQEYEYIRFDALAWLARRMKVPFYASFQGGDRTLSWIEADARQLSLRACSGLIVASSEERDRLAKAYPRIALDIANIPNPLDTGEWRAMNRMEARASFGLPQDGFIVFNHGRIDIRRKGLDILLKAWARFTDNSTGELVIIGSGQDSEAFAKLLGESGLSNVQWLSSYTTDRPLIRRWLSAADAYVTASRIEGMPVAPLEAMACGLPVVATDAQGLPDILADGEASGGLMVGQERPEEIAQALARLKDDRALRAQLGTAARKRVTEKFSIEAVGAALDDFLTKPRR
ncbi:glycosyltransferase family 4 protein (plasmid) [Rhizobium sp. CB3060]|uniref:glycosyltransferase family 4 protein n=1 Tax=Rhizobium sp. CB3060 TaxID=3138255 RepID=UPI0021A7E52A|nr:glycosyltransferase family 4 protein [Rhizobium tropici]UWU23863.1 glycosyltransferase family 4 protein [Rhizobium tropici]